MSKCNHDLWDQETACADGLCPLCMQQRIAELQAELARFEPVPWQGSEEQIIGEQQQRIAELEGKLAAANAAVHQAPGLLRRAEARIAELQAALVGLTDRYCDLVNSGDCGFWDPESEEPVIAAREALNK